MGNIKDLGNYGLLITKLDKFIRKYYINQIVKGGIYTLAYFLFFFLIITVLEYFGRFDTIIRTILFYGTLLINMYLIIHYILIPILHYLKLGNIISHDQAAVIIGEHFAVVKDKLLNTLQLNRLYSDAKHKELIKASIDQKIKEINPVPFINVINISRNKKYLKYAIIPFGIIILIILTSPDIIKNSTLRIINHSLYFDIPKPFDFLILNKKLDVVQFEDYLLKVKLSGEEIPNEAFIVMNGNRYILNKRNTLDFEYMIKNVQKDIYFNLYANDYHSEKYVLKVLPKPILMNFDINLKYPNYIKKKDEHLRNIGDLSVPEGTSIEWKFYTRNTSSTQISFDNNIFNTTLETDNIFRLKKQFFRSSTYTIFPGNKEVGIIDSIKYYISVTPDLYPIIKVDQYKDSFNIAYLFFTGEISDDYGFDELLFKYKIIHEETNSMNNNFIALKLPINTTSTNEQFYFTWNLKEIKIQHGDKVNYYFEIWDNDGVRGSKSARTPIMSLKTPTLKELKKTTNEVSEKIKEELTNAIKTTKELKSEIAKMRERILQKKTLSWEDKKELEKIIKKQKDLQERIEKLQKNNEQLNQFHSENKDKNEEIIEKQQRLEELFNEMLSEEMKEAIKELEDLLEKINKENVLEKLKDTQLSDEELSDELDRLLELFKQIQFEQKLVETIDELKQLSQKQIKTAQETKDKNLDINNTQKKQTEINNKYEDIKENLKDLEEINKDLENPHSLDDTREDQQEIDSELKNSLQQLSNNNRNKANESQQKASQKMKSLSEKLESMMNNMQMAQLMLDLASIRQILENLIFLSFDQEEIIRQLKQTNINSPKYKQIIVKQNQLVENTQIVKDSLYALSKRLIQIKSFVNREILKINTNIEKTIRSLESRQKGEAENRQQYTMTSINNLAVILSEIMENLQEQMAAQMKGSQMCQKPGKGKNTLPSMSKMQEQLNKQLNELTKQCNKPGGMKGISKELAELAAKQAAIRNALQKINQKENKDAKGSLGDLEKLMKEMEKTEKEVVNKQLTEEMLKRQKDISVKLLEAEKAQREREKSPKRVAERPKEYKNEEISSFKEYKKIKQKQLELYKTVPPSLKPYYRKLVELYYKTINF